MPGKRGKGEGLLEDALAALARALDKAGAPWMVIGGIAVIAHGVRRFTTELAEVPELVESFDTIVARARRTTQEPAEGGRPSDAGPRDPRPRRRRS